MARADIKAGAAYVELYCKDNRFLRGLRNARRSLSEAGASMIATGRQMAMAGAAALAPMILATSTFAAFDDQMRSVKAVTNATTAEFASLTATAKELGRTTSFTAVEVGALMAELGRAGFKPDQINTMTGAVLNLARATGTDATLASGIMAASIRQFGLAATDATRVADGLAATANKSFNTVEQLGEALSYAGPVARDFNMSLEDTLAILGGLGNIGIQASSAGTALRRLLTVSGAEAEKLQGIFGVAFVDAAGNARPLVDVLGEVNQATADLGTAARAAKFNEAFGLLGITGASAIGRAAGDIKGLAAELKAASGTAAKAAAEMDSGIGGSFRILTSAAEGVALAIGEALDGSVRAIVNSFTTAMGVATEWIGKNREIVTLAGAAAVGLVGMGGALIAGGISLKVAAVGVGVLATAMKGATIAAGVFKAVAIGVEVATLSLAAVMSLAAGTTAANSAAWIIFGALQASYPAVAALVVGAITAISTAFAGQTFAAGLATLAMNVFSVAAATASSVAATFWTILSGPAAPFLITAGAIVAAVGAIGAVAAIAAVRAMDLSRVVGTIKQALASLMATAKDVGGVLMNALSIGDYQAAVEAGWIGIRIAFWTGADAAVKAVGYLFMEAVRFTKNTLLQMLVLTGSTMSRIAAAMANPLRAAYEVQQGIMDLMNTKVTFSLSANATAATAELAALKEQMEGKVAARDASKADTDDAAAGEATRQMLRDIGLTDQQIDAITQRTEATKEGTAATEDGTKRFDEMNAALEEQIIRLREGEQAAERFRLKQLGLTGPQVEALEPLMQEIKHLERIRDLSKLRTGNIAAAGDRAVADGNASPQEVAQREREIVEQEVAAGRIDRQTGDAFNEESAQRQTDRMEKLREEARRLKEEMRTPGEALNAEMKKITQLQAAGVIDEKTALAAEDRARKEAAKAQGQFDGQSVGPKSSIATTSAHAALALGRGGGRSDIAERQLAATEKGNRELIRALREENDELRAEIKTLGLHHP